MVSLAKKHADSPLHVIASHCQLGKKPDVIDFITKNKWTPEMENFSLVQHMRFKDGVQKENYIPHYFIFDHTGQLRYHHQAGKWHGGDKDKYQQLVDELVAEVPLTAEQKRIAASKPLTEMRDWTSPEGQVIQAQLLEINGPKGKFRKEDGKVFWFELSKFSTTDQKLIQSLKKG